MKQYGVFRKKQQLCDFLVGFARLDQIGHPNFHGCKVEKFRRALADKGRNNVVQVGVEYIDQLPLIQVVNEDDLGS